MEDGRREVTIYTIGPREQARRCFAENFLITGRRPAIDFLR
jgi:hypothetical protein